MNISCRSTADALTATQARTSAAVYQQVGCCPQPQTNKLPKGGTVQPSMTATCQNTCLQYMKAWFTAQTCPKWWCCCSRNSRQLHTHRPAASHAVLLCNAAVLASKAATPAALLLQRSDAVCVLSRCWCSSAQQLDDSAKQLQHCTCHHRLPCSHLLDAHARGLAVIACRHHATWMTQPQCCNRRR